MSNLSPASLASAVRCLYLSTGDSAKKSQVLDCLSSNGIDAKVASKVWSMLGKTGRVKGGIVNDITDTFPTPNTVEIIRAVLLQLKPECGLSNDLIESLHGVTGLSLNTIQGALNALEQEYFLEQIRAVPPAQYVPRRWAA